MSKQIISTPNAPAAIGPYSQAVKAGNLVYLSGQIGLDPATMEMVDGVEAQALAGVLLALADALQVSEDRVISVQALERTIVVETESRVITVSIETRTITIN